MASLHRYGHMQIFGEETRARILEAIAFNGISAGGAGC